MTDHDPMELLASLEEGSARKRYRLGHRDPEAVAAHARESTNYRRSLADAEFNADMRAKFLADLPADPDVARTACRLGVSANLVYGRMQWDDEFADQVEDILLEHCRGGDLCGRPGGYKRGGRCWRCREAKRGQERPPVADPN